MNYGLYVSASGLLSSMHRQDVMTNNLANLDTVGFKVQRPATRERDPARIEDGLEHLPSNELIEKLGAGVQLAPTRIDFSQGSLKQTQNPLDVAIEGDGFFLLSAGRSGNTENVRFTRDGRFTLSSDATIVSAVNGMRLLSTRNQPIRVVPSEGAVTIDPTGRVMQGGREIAQVQVSDVPDRSSLRKAGENLYEASAEAIENRFRTDAILRQGMVEASGVNEISALMGIRGASGDASANAGMIRYHDRMMGQAISRLGRVV